MSEPGSIKDRHKIIGAKVASSFLQVSLASRQQSRGGP